MFRRNEFKKIVLQCVLEKGIASSRQDGRNWGALGVSHKNVSMTMLKCKRQRLLDRTRFKHGRVSEYLYMITERGRRRLAYYRGKEREVKWRFVENDAHAHQPRLMSSSVSQNQQNIRRFKPTKVMLAAQVAEAYMHRYHSLLQSCVLVVLALVKAARERDDLLYLYFIECAKNRKLLIENEHLRTGRTHSPEPCQYTRNVEGFAEFEIGIRLGKEIGAFNQLIQTQKTHNKILRTKSEGFQPLITDAQTRIKPQSRY